MLSQMICRGSGRTPSWPVNKHYTRNMGQNNHSVQWLRYELNVRGIGNLLPVEAKTFLYSVQTDTGGPSSLLFCGYSVLFPLFPDHEADRSLRPIYCQLNNKWNYITTPPIYPGAVLIINSGGETCGRTHRDPQYHFILVLFIQKTSDEKGNVGTRSHSSYLTLTPLHFNARYVRFSQQR